MGCMGLSLDDFCALDVEEFNAIYKAWKEREEAMSRTSWEQTRMLATICIQPHVKKKLTPKQLMPLPWDNERIRESEPKISIEDRKKRAAEMARKFGAETM